MNLLVLARRPPVASKWRQVIGAGEGEHSHAFGRFRIAGVIRIHPNEGGGMGGIGSVS